MIDTITIYVDMTLFLPSVVLFAALPDDQNLGEININNIQSNKQELHLFSLNSSKLKTLINGKKFILN